MENPEPVVKDVTDEKSLLEKVLSEMKLAEIINEYDEHLHATVKCPGGVQNFCIKQVTFLLIWFMQRFCCRLTVTDDSFGVGLPDCFGKLPFPVLDAFEWEIMVSSSCFLFVWVIAVKSDSSSRRDALFLRLLLCSFAFCFLILMVLSPGGSVQEHGSLFTPCGVSWIVIRFILLGPRWWCASALSGGKVMLSVLSVLFCSKAKFPVEFCS